MQGIPDGESGGFIGEEIAEGFFVDIKLSTLISSAALRQVAATAYHQ